MSDYADLIGLPFAYGGRGPNEFDCYGLVMKMSLRSGKILPDFGFESDQGIVAAMMGASLPQWEEIEARPGAIALIRVGRFVSHVAYVINDYQMIHSWEQSGGVSVVKLDQWKQRIIGFYQHVNS